MSFIPSVAGLRPIRARTRAKAWTLTKACPMRFRFDKAQKVNFCAMGTCAMITPAQLGGARAMLRWPAARLAEVSRVHFRTVLKIERGEVSPQRETQRRLIAALQAAGIVFGADGSIKLTR